MDKIQRIVDVEVEGTELQTKINALLGRPITKAEAVQGYQLHLDGDGGNTVGWKYDAKVNGKFRCSWAQHTRLGDAICDLGRLAKENRKLHWCFPESYRAYKHPQGEGNVKRM